MPKVSVIVPVYNVSKYLVKCLESLVNQTLKDIEIIVVNDGTLDDSQEIIDRYVKEFKDKVKSYIKPNGGLSDARNFGIKKATGEYIGFVDGDDFVDIRMFETMYKKAQKEKSEIVVCNLNYVYDYDIIPTSSNVYETTSNIKNIMLNIYPTAWNKIYKRTFITKHKLEFKKNVWYEDVEFIYRVLPYVKKISCVDKCFYQYVQREGAITKTYDKRLYNYIENWNGIVEYYKQNNLYDEFKKELEYCYVRYIYGTFIKQAMNFPEKKDFYDALDAAVKNVLEKFPRYRKNKYFYKGLKGLYLILFNRLALKISYNINRRAK